MMRVLKQNILFGMCCVLTLTGCGQDKSIRQDMTQLYGVWAAADAELVVTEKYALFFHRNGDSVEATLRENEETDGIWFTKFVSGYSFDVNSGEYEKLNTDGNKHTPFIDFARLKDGRLEVTADDNTVVLEQIEKLTLSEPYEMPYADESTVGQCLQNWQLGVFDQSFGQGGTNIQIGTNMHSYVYSENQYMIYLRAARMRHNNNGSLFAQNIRLMVNRQSGENTAYMEPDNMKISSAALRIDDSKFQPDVCTFDDAGIYWSFVSFEPTVIRLNGCGEEYVFGRPDGNSQNMLEWFVYKPY